jgi:hypothetical protein
MKLPLPRTCITINLVEKIKELKTQVTSLEKDLESVMKGNPQSVVFGCAKNPMLIRVDLDPSQIKITCPRGTRREANTKSRIWPRFFASHARLRGTM